jgi:uncharacterized membrane protein
MRALATRLAGAVLVLVLLLAPLAAHIALMTRHGAMLAGLLVAVQAAMVAWIAQSSIAKSSFTKSSCIRSSFIRSPAAALTLRIGLCGLVFAGVFRLAQFTRAGPVAAAAVPHAMTYLALLAVFGASLLPGREAVITILARRSRGRLPPEIVRYTRRVTLAWCGFFVAQLACSWLLLLFAPLSTWSLFINLGNLPLVGVMVGAEYAYRQWRHAARPPERLVDMLRIVRQAGTAPAGEGQ